jgi:integrase
MRVGLVGIHKVRKRLADGSAKTYYYAWRGGPKMSADPADEHAFGAEYFRLTRDRDAKAAQGLFPELVKAYTASPAYTGLKPVTQRSYAAAIDLLEAEFHSLEIAAISEPGARGLFLEFRDQFASTPRKADLMMSVLARILSFAADREMVARNPLERIERLSAGTRRDVIWTDEQIAAFLAKASPKMRLAMELARWTGQRQGDLLRLTWGAYDGTHIKLRQSKTGVMVRFRVYSELKAVLDATKREAATILTPTRKRGGLAVPWTGDGFRASWAAVCRDARIEGVTFHDLRGTFITLAYRKGSSIKEIAEISGHKEREAEAIIRRHYLAGESAIAQLEKGNK